MNEDNYSKRELDHYFGDLFKRMDKQDGLLSSIEAQTKKTNGRVSKLEWWRSAMIWGFSLVVTIVIALIPFFKK